MYEIVFCKDKEFDEDVNYTGGSFHSFRFVNCHFKRPVSFKKVVLGSWVIFEDCIFDEELCFLECRTDEDVNDVCANDISNSLIIRNSVTSEIIIRGAEDMPIVFQRGILFDHITISKNLQVDFLLCNQNGFTIDSTTVNGAFLLNFINVISIGFELVNSKVYKAVRFQTVYASSYRFRENVIDGSLYLWGAKVDSIIFNDETYDDEINIIAIECNHLSIIGGEFKKKVKITKGDKANTQRGSLNSVYIKNPKLSEGLIIKSGFQDERLICEKVQVVSSKDLSGDIIFEDLDITDILLFEGINYDANIQFNNVTAHKLHFKSFINNSSVIFQAFEADSNSGSELNVMGSNLGCTSFLNTNLDSFDKITVEGSILTNIITTGITWFDIKKLNAQSNDKDSQYWKKQREVFRQLKYCMEGNMDRPQSLIFKSYEMNAYTKSLKLNLQSVSDILLLNLNRFSNNHGLSWTTGVLFTVVAWQLFYAIFVMAKDGVAFPWESNCIYLLADYNYWSTAIQYLWLPDGLEELSDFYNDTQSALSLIGGTIAFLLGKIAIAYGIFQAVSAFRKYGKS